MQEELNAIIEQLDSILYSRPGLLAQFFGAVLTLVLGYIWLRMYVSQRVLQSKVEEWKEAFGYEKPQSLSKVDAQWNAIQEKMSSNDESLWKMAIVEADSIMDRLIKEMGYRGETMGERMQRIRPQDFPLLDDAWRAHKVRNFIAHDSTYKLTESAAKKTIEIYEKIFRELNILDND